MKAEEAISASEGFQRLLSRPANRPPAEKECDERFHLALFLDSYVEPYHEGQSPWTHFIRLGVVAEIRHNSQHPDKTFASMPE